MFNLKLFAFTVCVCGTVYSSSLPSWITPCDVNQSDELVAKCFLEEAIRVQKQFSKGIPELGVDALDPIGLDELDINASGMKFKQKGMVIKGLSNFQLKEIKHNSKSLTGKIVAIGNMSISSNYDVSGRLLLLPVKGQGKLKMKLENAEVTMRFKHKLVKGEDGKEHLHIYDVRDSHHVGNAVIRMDGLFGNDKSVGEAVNTIINENWRDLFKDFGPPSIKALSNKVVGIMNTFYGKVPYNELVRLNVD